MSIYDKTEKLWRHLKQQQTSNDVIPPYTGQHVLNLLFSHASKVAQINDDTGARMTFNEIRLKTIRAAQNLLKLGFERPQVFGIMVDSSDDLVPIMMAATCLACPIAPLHPMLTKDEIKRAYLKANPSVVFCDARAFDQLNEALKELPFTVQRIFTFGGHIDGNETVDSLFVETGEENGFVPVEIDPNIDIGAILCSSGTTGPSKCLKLPYSLSLCLYPFKCDPNGVIFCSKSIYWMVGMKPISHSIQNGLTRIITSKPLTPEFLLHLIVKNKITILCIASFELIILLKTNLIENVDLSCVEQIYCFGGKVPVHVIPQMIRHFKSATLTLYYGSTEVGRVSEAKFGEGQLNDGGNVLVDGCTAKIIDDNGNCCGPNEIGELCVKMEHPFGSYVDDPVANADAFDDEGFYRTNDLAYFDADNGRLFIQDRKKSVFKLFYFAGILIPLEIEEFLSDMPDIQAACVVGVPIADSANAALPAAVIVPKPNANLSKREIFDRIAEKFPRRSWLRAGVYFVESLPQTTNGKIMRPETTRMAIKLFETAIKQNDSDIQSFVSDIPEAFRKMIYIDANPAGK